MAAVLHASLLLSRAEDRRRSRSRHGPGSPGPTTAGRLTCRAPPIGTTGGRGSHLDTSTLHRPTRVRPSDQAWSDAMSAVFVAHDAHSRLPHHVLEAVGEELGVAARSVETRYGIHLGVMDAISGWQLGIAEIAEIAGADDFIDAYT